MKKEAERKRKEWNGAPWLRPLTASLTTTGEPLLQTFTGHLSPIDAVTITPDGLAVTGCNCQVVELRNGRTTAVSTSSRSGTCSGGDFRWETSYLWFTGPECQSLGPGASKGTSNAERHACKYFLTNKGYRESFKIKKNHKKQ